MYIAYPLDSQEFVRSTRADLVRVGGLAYGGLVDGYLALLEERLEERIRALMTLAKEAFSNGQYGVALDLTFTDPSTGGLNEFGQTFISLLEEDESRYRPHIAETLDMALRLVDQEIRDGVWHCPLPMNVVAVLEALFEVTVMARQNWQAAQKGFGDLGVAYVVNNLDGTVALDAKTLPASEESETKFWDLFLTVWQQIDGVRTEIGQAAGDHVKSETRITEISRFEVQEVRPTSIHPLESNVRAFAEQIARQEMVVLASSYVAI